jgi:hypothetical protein
MGVIRSPQRPVPVPFTYVASFQCCDWFPTWYEIDARGRSLEAVFMQANGKHKSSFPSHPGRRGAAHNSHGGRRYPLSDAGVRIRLSPATSACLVLVAGGATSAHRTSPTELPLAWEGAPCHAASSPSTARRRRRHGRLPLLPPGAPRLRLLRQRREVRAAGQGAYGWRRGGWAHSAWMLSWWTKQGALGAGGVIDDAQLQPPSGSGGQRAASRWS